MGTRDRLLAPLRRIVPQAPPAEDPTARALTELFGPQPPSPALFAPELLDRVPLERLRETVAALRERHGPLRSVRQQRELHRLAFTHGAELVWAGTDRHGRLTTLVTGPGALLARDSAALGVPSPAPARDDLGRTLPEPAGVPLTGPLAEPRLRARPDAPTLQLTRGPASAPPGPPARPPRRR
ncbi:hypothetical protein GXW82_36130 [Streptacidiphilus sp. 4-A2]|nr:hypothetical protein [Streptacidiphilus sp. 4-A2]